jgi:two-component system, cell cycle response regulator
MRRHVHALPAVFFQAPARRAASRAEGFVSAKAARSIPTLSMPVSSADCVDSGTLRFGGAVFFRNDDPCQQRSARMSSRSATIFVADDNPILLQGLERALTANGYLVQTAETGAALLRLLEANPTTPDLLLLDVMMPEMSGIDVLRHIQADLRWSDLPVVLITAANDDQLPVSALQHGAVDFLTKPFRLGELVARVEAHVSRYRELRRARAESHIRLEVIDVVRDLNSVVTAGEMFNLVTARAARIWGVSECLVAIDEGDGTIRVAASSNDEPVEASLLSLSAWPEVRAVLESDTPLLVEDAAASPLFEAVRARQGTRGPGASIESSVAVPLPISDDTRGLFLLRSYTGEPPLGQNSLEIAQQIVDGMTRVLGRAQVFETLVEQRRQLDNLAHTDELTGCASRRAVMRYLSEELDLARRRNAPLSVVLLDLDHFKEINDSYGHLAGDAVLRTFGEWLRSEGAHRVKDCAGRYGGDEFVVVLPDTEPEGALRFAERARDYLASVTFVFGDIPTRASLSAGIAAWPAMELESVEKLIESADSALYQAKQTGRDCIRLAKLNGDPHFETPDSRQAAGE